MKNLIKILALLFFHFTALTVYVCLMAVPIVADLTGDQATMLPWNPERTGWLCFIAGFLGVFNQVVAIQKLMNSWRPDEPLIVHHMKVSHRPNKSFGDTGWL